MDPRSRIALSRPVLAAGRVRIAAHDIVRHRQSRPWTAMLAVPLAINASWMSQQWWAFLPLAGCAWWCANRTWPWTWIVAVEAGAFGTLWSYSYASALGFFSTQRMVVCAIWTAMALALAGVSASSRRSDGHRADYPGY